MTVKELRQKLEGLPEDMEVLGRGYESGYDSLKHVQIQELVPREDAGAWYEGAWQTAWSDGVKKVTIT